MKQFVLCIVVILLCAGSGLSQLRRKVTPKPARQIGNKIPSELMEQIINDYSNLGVRDIINNAFDGSVAEYTRDWRVERIDLNRDRVLDFLIYPLYPFSGNHAGMVLIYQKTSIGYRGLTIEGSEPSWSDNHNNSPATKLVVGNSYTNGFVNLYQITGRKRSAIIFNGRYYK